ncbi:hypothetical protein QJS10_CPB12g00448 [Acorus calamus]|uniref:Thioredoxin domain-containing protein n=1 Tax=Acorus calamus TaxID=4465 RepID=A0AAV9DKX2_ACOCL|nr:hypothetical protein QJS10_CPB12g00448 [Acorus calamus]
MGLSFGKSVKWWEKGLQPNMKEINSAQDLVDSLLNAGNKLVVVDFFSPGCGGCKALHPKVTHVSIADDPKQSNPAFQLLRNSRMHWPSTARIVVASGQREA